VLITASPLLATDNPIGQNFGGVFGVESVTCPTWLPKMGYSDNFWGGFWGQPVVAPHRLREERNPWGIFGVMCSISILIPFLML